MIPQNLRRDHVLAAIKLIDAQGVPSGRKATAYQLVHAGQRYPPKYVVSLANRFANGSLHPPSRFSGGLETNSFLSRLGFEICGSPRPGAPARSPRRSIPTDVPVRRRHSERCAECKTRVFEMLVAIYGSAERNRAFAAGVNPEDFRDSPHYGHLKRIHKALGGHRGFQDFIRAKRLPHCDYFVPDPGGVVEFDESQHFTIPRKIALELYPDDLPLGYDRKKWINLCETIQARDNNPPDRDEQRAWYDTLRDFLPGVLGLKPTIRLFASEHRWCRLHAGSVEDRNRFQQCLRPRPSAAGDWLATVILQSDGHSTNRRRLQTLEAIVRNICGRVPGNGLVLFPAGWFKNPEGKAEELYPWIESAMRKILRDGKRDLTVCLGIDGRVRRFARDQIAIAVDKNGIVALARKFHPTAEESGVMDRAADFLAEEGHYSRVFVFGGRKYFLCVCYDVFGIRQLRLPNALRADVVLDLVHGFRPKGQVGSGENYFAKHGFGGASKHWKLPVFSAAVFFNRPIPPRWPSGVLWNRGETTTAQWKYEHNPIRPIDSWGMPLEEGSALTRIFSLRDLATHRPHGRKPQPSLCVIPCGKRKIWDIRPSAGPIPAKEAYIGIFARKCREYAEKLHPGSWCILSAKHGFLLPDDIVHGPYNVSFNDRRTNPISLQALRIQMRSRGLGYFERVIVLGGRHYTEMVRVLMPEAQIEEPLRGCSGIGSMMKRINELMLRDKRESRKHCSYLSTRR